MAVTGRNGLSLPLGRHCRLLAQDGAVFLVGDGVFVQRLMRCAADVGGVFARGVSDRFADLVEGVAVVLDYLRLGDADRSQAGAQHGGGRGQDRSFPR